MSPRLVTTNWWQKLLASAANLIFFVVIGLILYYNGFSLNFVKIVIIALCFIHTWSSFYFRHGRSLGMAVVGSKWKRNYGPRQWFIYSALYTLSFSTVFYWVWFPFDLLLINLLLIQLPTVLLTKTTLHGWLAGGMTTVIKN